MISSRTTLLFAGLAIALPVASYLMIKDHTSQYMSSQNQAQVRTFSFLSNLFTSTKKVPSPLEEEISLINEQETNSPDHSPSATEETHKEPKISFLPISLANIVIATNQQRVRAGLQPLASSPELNAVALEKMNDMLDNNYFDHTNPDTERGFDIFFDIQSYQFIKVAENLAQGNFLSSNEIVDAWMKSPSHRKNILDPAFTEIGIAVHRSETMGQTNYTIVQHFARPRNSCPQIDEQKKQVIEALRYELESITSLVQTKREEIALYESGNIFLTQEYERLINEHNILVGKYNAHVAQIQDYVRSYNQHVQQVQSCLAGR